MGGSTRGLFHRKMAASPKPLKSGRGGTVVVQVQTACNCPLYIWPSSWVMPETDRTVPVLKHRSLKCQEEFPIVVTKRVVFGKLLRA